MHVLEYNYQVAQIELRQRLQDTLDKKGWKQKDLVLATEIDSVTISQILNNKQKITLSQLVAVTKALDLQEDTFYEEFLGDCFNESGKMSPIKTAEFFISCIKAERYDITKGIMALINEDTDRKRLLDNTFKMAEFIFSSDQRNYSLPLYDIVIVNSTTRNERLAIAYLRRFIITRDVDLTVSGYETLHQLQEYLPLLPHEHKFEAYYKILTFYNVVEKWDKLLHYSKELKAFAIIEGNQKYIAEALLHESFSYKESKNFDLALQITKEYSVYGDYYKEISRLNELLILVEMGKLEVIDEILTLISPDQAKLFSFLPVALETYLKKEMFEKIKKLLQDYEIEIEQLSCKTDKLNQKFKLRLFQALSSYYLIRGDKNKGFHYNLEALQLALMFKNVERIRSIILMHYQYNPSEEHKEMFINIMARGNNQNEKDNNILTNDSVLLRLYRNGF
ncbi:helix-turn-helix transcriptional regulator [Brevibacillus laterosporus]|uniref:helix-turn-helix domain-containing protein n=1 Tax=Brevibacillus laterosporus TaxID=1465 RepID=UPI00215C573A|nr:helix-turn-helix transcriptional regulator [Brevibacillus laterosporus]MCR8940218.1 helix-turn-helix domain-containing protein [Brevibacillus laterosporus]MCZ0842857.1 helix-turn-helix transcriptional regulator [Brevibacillus laterosporus]MCZ0847635.1 helix-turn-helix transcriptional regulator [Brevibacillus laterosporus]